MENKQYLIIDDTKYETQILPRFQNRKNYEIPNPNKVKAFIPGTVINLYVSVGDEVRKGTKVLLLEAMKMKNTLVAPITGRVKNINVKVGERVSKNHVLIEFE